MSDDFNPKYVAGPMHSRPANKRSVDWISGEFPSAKRAMDFRMVRYDGMLSQHFILLLEMDALVLSYWERPGPISWSDGLRRYVHNPTFSIDHAVRGRIAVTVMWTYRVTATNFAARFPHIRRAAIERGYADFELWTELEIEVQPRLANAGLFASERSSFVSHEASMHRLQVVLREIGGRATVRDLRRASGLGDRAFRMIVRLVADGLARMARPDVPFDDHAVVELI